jgi:hypothetical protein
MKKIKLFIIVFILFFTSSNSQVFQDSLLNYTIPFVEIYSDTGNFIGTTDEKGEITPRLLEEIEKSQTINLYTSHILYENKKIKLHNLNKNNRIKLNPITSNLKEVTINYDKIKKKYLKLNCYFRSYQINNDRVHYFMDGIADIYINTKNNKSKVNKIITNRTFENKNIKQLDEKGPFQVIFKPIGVPTVNEKILFSELIKNYTLDSISNNKINIKNKSNKMIGFLSNSELDKSLNIQLKFISEENPKVMNVLGNESILYNYNINTNFSTSYKNMRNLISYRELRNYKLKNRKDANYQKVDLINEIYILSSEYTDDIIDKGHAWDFYSLKPTNYTNNFWQNIQNPYYQPLPESIEKYIKENLTEVK